jgi:hypothetical protein
MLTDSVDTAKRFLDFAIEAATHIMAFPIDRRRAKTAVTMVAVFDMPKWQNSLSGWDSLAGQQN